MAFQNIYHGKRVLVTGHTGFKGGWLSHWLLELGAQVHGLALPPEQNGDAPVLFDDLGLAARLGAGHALLDVRDRDAVARRIAEVAPEIIFHMAAQPLVRLSYADPVETFATNVMGSAHVLEAVRAVKRRCAVVAVTTDKCYENTRREDGYREDDPMGGHDPYSASKGCAELVVQSFRRSFFSRETGIAVASARAGNVIGGGDWAKDRIMPDCVRALARGETVPVRNPHATRPWQHVLEPLSGYLALGALQLRALTEADGASWECATTSYNFGPQPDSTRTVRQLVETALETWPGRWRDTSDPKAPHEAALLRLDIGKAHRLLAWKPVWEFEKTVARTTGWYRRRLAGEDGRTLVMQDLLEYTRDAKASGLAWVE